jgi:hypothetical protein
MIWKLGAVLSRTLWPVAWAPLCQRLEPNWIRNGVIACLVLLCQASSLSTFHFWACVMFHHRLHRTQTPRPRREQTRQSSSDAQNQPVWPSSKGRVWVDCPLHRSSLFSFWPCFLVWFFCPASAEGGGAECLASAHSSNQPHNMRWAVSWCNITSLTVAGHKAKPRGHWMRRGTRTPNSCH